MVHMDEPQKHYVGWKKPDQKTIYCMSPYIWNGQKRQIYRERQIVWGWVWEQDWPKMGRMTISGVVEIFSRLDCGDDCTTLVSAFHSRTQSDRYSTLTHILPWLPQPGQGGVCASAS